MGSLEVRSPAELSETNQDEYEQLEDMVRKLRAQRSKLREEITSLAVECGKLKKENKSIKKELCRVYGPDVVSEVAMEPDADHESCDDEESTSSDTDTDSECTR